MIIEFAIDNFLSSAYNRPGNLRIDGTQCFVHLGCSLFDLAKSANKLAWEAQIADREIKYGALSAGAIMASTGTCISPIESRSIRVSPVLLINLPPSSVIIPPLSRIFPLMDTRPIFSIGFLCRLCKSIFSCPCSYFSV